MSYKIHGSGPSSRNAQFVVHQCVQILYAIRCTYLVHVMDEVPHRKVDAPTQLSVAFLNSQVNSNFSALQNIKRPGKQCIPDHHRQNISWTGSSRTSLQVHTGQHGLGRVEVSHQILRETFEKILRVLKSELHGLHVLEYSREEFLNLKDISSSVKSGEGLGLFNYERWSDQFIAMNSSKEFRVQFVQKANKLYRLCMAAIHLSGGPSPRGTEQAVTRLLNSETELVRNVHLIDGTIGIQSG
jgi:hypothetical protein